MLRNVEIQRVRHHRPGESVSFLDVVDVGEAIRVGHARRRAQQQRVRHGEYRRGRADTNRERERRGEREDRIASKQPNGVAQIPSGIIEPRERPCVALKLLRLLDAAKRTPRGEPRLLRCHTSTLKLIFEQSQVRGDLAG